jgi:hypothetical protein
MSHSAVNAKGEFVIFDDDGKKMTKKALAQQAKQQVEHRHPLGLYITADEDGTQHFWRGDNEVSKDVWLQQHPHLRRGQDSGRNQGGGNGGNGAEQVGATVESANAEEQVRQGIREARDRARAKAEAPQGE